MLPLPVPCALPVAAPHSDRAPVAAGRMLVYLVPPAAVTPAERLSGPPRRLCGGAIIVFLRIEVESPVGARGECLLQAAAGRETEDG